MTKIMKKSLITVVLLFFAITLFPTIIFSADQPSVVIKFSQWDGEVGMLENIYPAYVQTFKSLVESKSNGKITIQVFPNQQLGSLPSTLEQVYKGTIEMTSGQNTGLFASYYPDIAVFDIPFAFRDLLVAFEVAKGEFGINMKKNIVEETGIRILSFLPTSYRNFGNNIRLIKEPNDLKGMKIRVMQGDIYMELMKVLGANPVVIDAAELYTAIQTGVADGQENSPYNILGMKLEEVIDYYTLSAHLLNIAAVSINEKFFQSLPKEYQKIVLDSARIAEISMIGTAIAKEKNIDLKAIKKAGVEIYQPNEEEILKFKELAQEPLNKLLVEKMRVNPATIDEMFQAIQEAEYKLDTLWY